MLIEPANAIVDTSSYDADRTLESLPRFLETFCDAPQDLAKAPSQNGSPHTIIVTGAGLRAADLVRYDAPLPDGRIIILTKHLGH